VFEKDDSTSPAPPDGRSGITRSALLSLPGTALCLRTLPEALLRTALNLRTLPEALLRTALSLRTLPEALPGTAFCLGILPEALLRTALSLRTLPEALPGTALCLRTLPGTLFHVVLRTVLGAFLEPVLRSLRKRSVPETLPRSLRKNPVRRELSACAGHGASPHASGALTHSTCRCGLCDSHPGRSCCCLSQNGVGRSQPGEGDPDGGDCHEPVVHSCLRWFGVWG